MKAGLKKIKGHLHISGQTCVEIINIANRWRSLTISVWSLLLSISHIGKVWHNGVCKIL